MPTGDSADALREVWMEGYNRGLSESGRKSAERADKAQDEVARLACENAALRKRVEQLPERAWLIESRFTPAPTWWMGTDHPAPWTQDSLKAVRFCRKQDAEAAMAALQDGHFCFVSEHQWGLGGPMRGTEEGE